MKKIIKIIYHLLQYIFYSILWFAISTLLRRKRWYFNEFLWQCDGADQTIDISYLIESQSDPHLTREGSWLQQIWNMFLQIWNNFAMIIIVLKWWETTDKPQLCLHISILACDWSAETMLSSDWSQLWPFTLLYLCRSHCRGRSPGIINIKFEFMLHASSEYYHCAAKFEKFLRILMIYIEVATVACQQKYLSVACDKNI